MKVIEICPFDIRSATEAEYACLNAFENVLRFEVMPEDPPISLSEDMQRWHALPEFFQEAAWAAWEKTGSRMVAFGKARIYLSGDNLHLIEFEIKVLPDYRRQGLGRRLLRLIVDHARSNNRRLMTTETNGKVPAGAAFLSGMGGRRGLEECLNQLRVADLDRSLLQRWTERSSSLASQFQLGLWEGPYPESHIQEISDLLQVVANDQPRDTLEMEDSNFTPALVRQIEPLILAGGRQRWVLHATYRNSGRIAGITEVYWSPNRPAILEQGFTGVLPEYRGRGLGRWLKAEMLNKILRDRPEMQVIRTGNADSNAPMLRINVELGFRPMVTWSVWQVETQAVGEYLAARP